MTFFVMDTFVTVQFHAAEQGRGGYFRYSGRCGAWKGFSSHLPRAMYRIDQAAGAAR